MKIRKTIDQFKGDHGNLSGHGKKVLVLLEGRWRQEIYFKTLVIS